MTYVILDTETGGLDPLRDELIEVSWWVWGDPQPKTAILPHTPSRVSTAAAELNGYVARGLSDHRFWAMTADINVLYEDLVGATIVGANPTFDVAFLGRWFNAHFFKDPTPWHYRLIDVQAMAFGLGLMDDLGRPLGLNTIAHLLRDYEVPAPDHTAEGDVRCTKQIFDVLCARVEIF